MTTVTKVLKRKCSETIKKHKHLTLEDNFKGLGHEIEFNFIDQMNTVVLSN